MRASGSSPAGPPKSPLAAALAFAFLVAVSGGCGSDTRPIERYRPLDFTPMVDTGKSVIPSSEQQEALEELGLPDHFWISLDPRTGDRVESWSWTEAAEELSFHNGRLIRRRTLRDRSGEYPPTSLRPQDFSTGTDLDDLKAALGAPYFSTTSDLQGKQMLLLFYTRAVATFTDGSFSSIDTMVHPFERLPEADSGL